MLLLPFCLYGWAKYTSAYIDLPVPLSPIVGIVISIVGVLVIAWGMLALVIFGRGLPMNAYPPDRYVSRGIYKLLRHPIYTGTGLLSFGLALFFQSSSGFWLVSPLFCLSMIVYVAGYENEKIKMVVGYFDNRTFFSPPSPVETKASWISRLRTVLLTFIPWALLYELFIFIGVPVDAVYTNLPFEQYLPVFTWVESLYLLSYVLAILIPFILRSDIQLRRFVFDAWWAMGAAFFFYTAFPLVVAQRQFVPTDWFGEIIYKERSYDGAAAALPAFHVIWAFLMAKYFSIRFGSRVVWYLLAVCIALSCIGNGNHSVMDVLAGALVFLFADKRKPVWDYIRNGAERIANSWHEWHIGKMRLINHGIYGGAAAFAGLFIAGSCLPAGYSYLGLIVGISAIVGAALWAQIVEGSPALLRPYGYYGSVVGIFASIGLITLFCDISFLYILSAFALGGPWIQVVGRLRCLVQGCCHGKPCKPGLGLRFTSPQSRVLKIASLKGVPIHPTQLYSMGSNLIIGLLLFRFVSLQMPVSFIAGMYLILNGLARFVEEGLRGEPQTAYWGDLRLYQWLALINIIAGALITCINTSEYLRFHINGGAVFYSFTGFIIATAAYGMDFPGSNKRFARLTS